MLKIDWHDELKRILESGTDQTTADALVFPIIERENGCHYYKMFGLKLYCTCKSEASKRKFAQMIIDYANSLESLEDGEFSLEYVEYQNPKLDNGKFFASVCYEMQPTKEK